MKKYLLVAIMAMLVVSCKQERHINVDQLVNNYAVVTIPAPDDLLRDLTCNSYEIVKSKYSKKRK